MLPDTSRAKSPHLVHVTGCDDRTEVAIDLTDSEFAAVQKLAAATAAASRDACQPVVRVIA